MGVARTVSISLSLWFFATAFFATALAPFAALAQPTHHESDRIEHPNGQPSGTLVDIAGNTALVIEPEAQSNSLSGVEGLIRLLTFDGSTWVEEVVFSAAPTDLQFGGSPTLTDETVAFTLYDTIAEETVAVIYRRVGDAWTEEDRVFLSESQYTVVRLDLSDNLLVARRSNQLVAYRYDAATGWDDGTLIDTGVSGGIAVGSVEGDEAVVAGTRVYRYDTGRNEWELDAELTVAAFDPPSSFGRSVAIDNGVVVLGPSEGRALDGVMSGTAHVYRYDGTEWIEEAHLLPITSNQSRTHIRVAIEGDRIVLGAPIFTGHATRQGAIEEFRFDGTTWLHTRRVTASDGATSDFLGWAVALEEGMVVAGALSEPTTYLFDMNAPRLTSCEPTIFGDVGSVEVNWEATADYEEIEILLDGEVVATEPGPFSWPESGSYTVSDLAPGSVVTIGVRGVRDTDWAGIARCEVEVAVPPVLELDCSAFTRDGLASVSWTNADDYDAIEIFVDGEFVISVGGDDEFADLSGLEVERSRAREVTVVAQKAGIASVGRSCRVISLDPVEFDSCSTPTTPTGSFFDSIAVPNDGLWAAEVRVVLDLTLDNLRNFARVSLLHPNGAEVQLALLLPDEPMNGTYQLLIDQDGRRGELDPTRPRDVRRPDRFDFSPVENALADGAWQLRLSGSGAGSVTVNEWCLRISGCYLTPPTALTTVAVDESVELEWENRDTYDGVRVERDGELLAELAGDATSYVDPAPPPGISRYRVAGIDDVNDCTTPFAIAWGSAEAVLECGGEIPVAVVLDPVPVGTVEVMVDSGTTGMIALTSPWGTEVQLQSRPTTGLQDDLHPSFLGTGRQVIFSDSGEPHRAPYDVQFARMKPRGPGRLSDFAGEIGDGEWTLDTALDIRDWCLSISRGCDLNPPRELTCEWVDPSDVLLTWATFDEIDWFEIERDGQVVAIVPEGTNSYTDSPAPSGAHEYRVWGVSGISGCRSGSPRCLVSVAVETACTEEFESEFTPPFSRTWTTTLESMTTDLLSNLEVFYFGDHVGSGPISIESPSGTTVLLHRLGRYYFAPFMDVTFSDRGAAPRTDDAHDCGGCRVAPPAPGRLSDLDGESAVGTWTLYSETFAFEGYVGEVCMNWSLGCPIPAVESLSAIVVDSEVELEWENPQAYDALVLLRDGEAVDPGTGPFDPDAGVPNDATFAIDVPPAAGRYRYQVSSYDSLLACGRVSEPVEVSVGRIDQCAESDVWAVDPIPSEDEVDTSTTIEWLDPAGPGLDTRIGAVEISVRLDLLDLTFLSNEWAIWARSPSGTVVLLQDGGYRDSSVVDLTYSDLGEAQSFTSDLALDDEGRLVTPWPGRLDSFAGEPAEGEWTLTFRSPPEEAVLEEWCVGIYPMSTAPATPNAFLRGDCDGDGVVESIADAIFLLASFLPGSAELPCVEAADVDDSGEVSAIVDAIYLIEWGFLDGLAPPAPGDECGVDPLNRTPDCVSPSLGCE